MNGENRANCRIYLPLAILAALSAFGVGLPAERAAADEVRYYVKDGITYRETRRVVQRPVVETKYERREQIFYREQYKTNMQQSYRTVQVPVTEYRTMACLQNRWNPFAQPYYTYRTVPTQRMEVRQQVVQLPVTTRELVPEKRIVQVPVTSQRMAQEEQITRVAVSAVPAGTPVYGQSTITGPIGGIARLDGISPTNATAGGQLQSSTFTPLSSQIATQPGVNTLPAASLAARPSTATLSPSSSVAPSAARTGPLGAAPQPYSPASSAQPAGTLPATNSGGRY
jgi:hypothetical protein